MQTPKTRNGSAETPQKTCSRATSSEGAPKISPRAIKGATEAPLKLSPRVVRQLKTSSQDSDPASSSTRASRTPKDRSSNSKVTDRKSPRSPAPELQRKHPSKAAELESQISQLENDLKKVKDQLTSSEAEKKQAEEDANESKRQLLELSLKLGESQKQLAKKSISEETEPANASECLDSVLESELENIKKQHLTNSEALESAVSEINSLKIQLETLAESEAAQTKRAELSQAELNDLKINLKETLALMEGMKNQVEECKESEAQARALVGETLMQLETAKKTVESLRSDGGKTFEANDTIASELEQSRARVNSLEELVRDLKADIENADSKDVSKLESNEGNEAELATLKSEVEQLKSALEASQMRYNAEQVRVAKELTSAWEFLEQIKASSRDREDEIEKALKKTKSEVEELKANLMDKENELQGICEENEELHQRLESTLSGRANLELEKETQKARADIERVKSNLVDKETELQNIMDENEMLKQSIKKKETNKAKVNDEMADELEAARCAEREALMKLGYLTEEVDKSNRKVARVGEQLDAAQAANAEMEAELRKMKVQSDQWRKAAEAAAAMLSTTGNNGKFMDRTASMDNRYSPRSGGRNASPYSDDGDEDLLKRKAPNMLKKIGVLWKKPQK